MPGLEYKLGKRVAAGGSGVVYRAMLHDGRPAAVKRLPADAADDRLVREARTLASLDHPNIVRFYGMRTLPDDQVDLVMEWVGPSVAQLARTGAVSIGAAIHIATELLRALGYLHERGALHRDVSPRNVLLGAEGAVKLVDFGLARPIAAPRTTAVLRGSPPYISPEQLRGSSLDGRSDLFAAGVLIYELVTGSLPLRSAADIEDKVPIAPLQSLRPEAPATLDAVVRRLLQYDVDQRFASAHEAIAALCSPDGARAENSAGRADLALLLRERGLLAAHAPRPWQRHRRVAAALLATGLALGGAALYLRADARRADSTSTQGAALAEPEAIEKTAAEPRATPESEAASLARQPAPGNAAPAETAARPARRPSSAKPPLRASERAGSPADDTAVRSTLHVTESPGQAHFLETDDTTGSAPAGAREPSR